MAEYSIAVPNTPFGEFSAQERVIALVEETGGELMSWESEIIDEIDFDGNPMKKITVELKGVNN